MQEKAPSTRGLLREWWAIAHHLTLQASSSRRMDHRTVFQQEQCVTYTEPEGGPLPHVFNLSGLCP